MTQFLFCHINDCLNDDVVLSNIKYKIKKHVEKETKEEHIASETELLRDC